MNVRVNLGERSYDIVVTSGDLAGVGPFARQRAAGQSAFVVTDANARVHATVVAKRPASARSCASGRPARGKSPWPSPPSCTTSSWT
jgi:hypothetical protein